MQQATECENCNFNITAARHLCPTHRGTHNCNVGGHDSSKGPHLSSGVLDGVLVEGASNAGVQQALLDNLLQLVALVGLEDDAAAAQARGDARHQPLRQRDGNLTEKSPLSRCVSDTDRL